MKPGRFSLPVELLPELNLQLVAALHAGTALELEGKRPPMATFKSIQKLLAAMHAEPSSEDPP